jgi:hypothetical protein
MFNRYRVSGAALRPVNRTRTAENRVLPGSKQLWSRAFPENISMEVLAENAHTVQKTTS